MKENIGFMNKDVLLEGTLYKPDSEEPCPVVIATHPSGEGLRDSDIFIHLKEIIPEIGIGVFLYDRRGSGKSTGDFDSATFYDLADDLVSAVENLEKRSDIDSEKIALWGLSQGGWIAPLTASKCHHVSHLIAVSSSGGTPADQMTYSAGFAMKEQGFSIDEIDLMKELHKEVLRFYRGEIPRSQIRKKLNEHISRQWFAYSYLDDDLPDNPEETKWYREMDFDPVPVMKKLDVPVLLLYAEKDPWVDIDDSIDKWKEKGPENCSVYKIEDANHFMKSISQTGLDGSKGPHSEKYLNILTSWIVKHMI